MALHRGDFYIITADGRKLTGTDAARQPITIGTRIVTGPNSRVQLLLADETAFTLGPDSDFVIDEFVYDPDTRAGKVVASMMKGSFRWITGKLALHTPGARKLRLPVGDIGIRGTDFEAECVPGHAGYIKLFDGQLEITGTRNSAAFIMAAKQMVIIYPDGSLGRPVPLQ